MSEEIKDARDLYRRMSESDLGSFTKTDLYKITNSKMPKSRMEAAFSQLLRGQYIFVVDDTADDRRREYALLGDTRPADIEAWQ